jgi:hypothetical protein
MPMIPRVLAESTSSVVAALSTVTPRESAACSPADADADSSLEPPCPQGTGISATTRSWSMSVVRAKTSSSQVPENGISAP